MIHYDGNTDVPAAEFATRDEARRIVAALDSRPYMLRHGEHSRPDYVARKIRGRDVYEIYVRRHYYGGTLHALPNAPMGWRQLEGITTTQPKGNP